MTAAEFRAIGIALFNEAEGWHSALARKLDISSQTIRRWAKDGPPDHAVVLIYEVLGLFPPNKDYPRDEWIVGDGVESDREYIIHLVPPRFSARVVLVESDGTPSPEEGEANTFSGVSFSGPDYTLCEIIWFDPAPKSDADLQHLLLETAKTLAK